MWRYLLLAAPIIGLALFFAVPFELALIIYLPAVCLAFWLFDRLAARAAAVREPAHSPRGE